MVAARSFRAAGGAAEVSSRRIEAITPCAAESMSMTSRELGGWIKAGELESEETPDGLLLPWSEVVSFAIGFWDPEEIERALGDDLAKAIPEQLRIFRCASLGSRSGSHDEELNPITSAFTPNCRR
jgi:hypothetical protein